MTRLLAPLAALALASACMPCDWSANDCANNWNLNGATVLLIDRVNSAPDATPIPAEQRRAVEEGTLRANPAMAQACSEGLDDRESGQPASLEACRHLFEVNQQANPETR